ncbi:MAG: DUF4838 domain-containing protein [candidate division WS1 bacterium]|nr:DUF4838 domain-containing protein [candidate division WS1 bacterium]
MAFGDYFAIVPMDGSAYSKAPEDQALMNQEELANRMFSNGRWSEYIWGFTNEVAREIRKTHPDKYLVQLAYAKYAYYPQGFRVEPNVAVQVCLSSRGWWCPAVEANDTKVLREWGTKEPGRPIYMFNYYCFPNDYTAYREGQGWHVFPAFFAHTAARQAQLYKQYGVRGIYYCGVPTAPDDYFVTKLYDDPALDIDAMLEEYFQLYYGAAAEPMKQMYLRIESLFSDPKNYPLSIQLDQQNYRQSEQFAWGCVGTAERMAELQKLMEQAKAQAQTEMEKRRVRIFEREIWDYMVEGRRKYEARAPEGSLASITVPKVAGAGGDAQQVNWAEAALLDGPWYHEGGSLASRRSLGGRVAHDGEYLYVELTEKCDTAKLQASPQVYPFDTWEVLVGRRRALPYREYAVGPTGMTVSLSNGEVEDRLHHPLEVPGWKASADPSAGDEWVAHLVFPLETIVAGGVRPGESLFVGVFRAESPALSGVSPVRVYSWARGCTWHDPTRMAEFKLAE